jgi:hypothetical protein
MKKEFIKAVFVFVMALMIVGIVSAEQLTGKIDSGAGSDWQSSWIDLSKMTDFHRGERLKITVQGTAEKVVVRLLPNGKHPSSSEGIVGNVINVPNNKVLEVNIEEERRNIVQISVHGGSYAWHTPLGSNNGSVIISSIERVSR